MASSIQLLEGKNPTAPRIDTLQKLAGALDLTLADFLLLRSFMASDNQSPFLSRERILENELAFGIYDAFPVTEGHMLVCPLRVFPDYFESTELEVAALWALVAQARGYLIDKFGPLDFNIGINCGPAAGQTIWHAHIHVIPRREGDVSDPRGGVRGVIADRQRY